MSRWSLTSRNALFDRVQRLKESEVEIIFVKHDLLKRILSIFFMILCAPFALFSEEAAVDLEESWRATSIRLLPSKKTHATAGELLYYEMLRSSGGFY